MIPTRRTNATTVAKIFLKTWVADFGNPGNFLTENGLLFKSKFTRAVCFKVDVNPLPSKEYYLQTNGQEKRYNSAMVACLLHYVAEHERD